MMYYMYKTINLTNNKFYIGVHQTTDINDGYMGSGKKLKKDIKNFGKNNFIKEILQFFSAKEEMLLREAEIVNFEFCNRDDTYNVMPGGGCGSAESNGLSFKGKKHTEATKQKIREAALKRKPISSETKTKMSLNNYARKNPETQKEHARKAASYKKTEEHKKKVSDSLKRFNNDPKNVNRGGRKNLGKKRLKIKCPYCSVEGAKNVMIRFHFDNCKFHHITE